MAPTSNPRIAKGGSKHSLNLTNRPDGGSGSGRTAGTIKRLKMYRSSKARRNKQGKIVKQAAYQSYVESGTRARVEPSRAWFANTKTVTQDNLQKYEENLNKVKNAPNKVLLKKTNLPIRMLSETRKGHKNHLLHTESFESTFGKKSQRKRPSLSTADLMELAGAAGKANDEFNDKNAGKTEEELHVKEMPREYIFSAGMSKRIWGELYKVIDSSDVILQVIDARDPMGTRCSQIENYLAKEKSHKHLVLILNKIDLVPTWVTRKWVSILSKELPTLAFHASMKNPFGKGSLIGLLRQFSSLHKGNNQISVGIIGYPNVGKSSLINSLMSKKVCNVAPIPGETKVWQYVTLMKRIYLIDCPGVVYSTEESDEEKVLKGVVRIELVQDPTLYIDAVLRKVKKEHIKATYNIDGWSSSSDFLEKLANKSGKLLKGGEADESTVAKMVINDWQRGKLPYYVPPPEADLEGEDVASTSGAFKVTSEKAEK